MSITPQTSIAEQQTKLPRRTRKPRLPDARHSDLMRLYVKRGYITTKKATKDFLESMGFRASPESIDEYMCLGGFVHRQRETRVVRRYEAKFGARPKAAEFTKVSPKGNGRSGDIWQRLSRLRERAVNSGAARRRLTCFCTSSAKPNSMASLASSRRWTG